MLATIPVIACTNIPDLLQEATSLTRKFQSTMLSFGRCHNMYTKKEKLSNEEISTLGKLFFKISLHLILTIVTLLCSIFQRKKLKHLWTCIEKTLMQQYYLKCTFWRTT